MGRTWTVGPICACFFLGGGNPVLSWFQESQKDTTHVLGSIHFDTYPLQFSGEVQFRIGPNGFWLTSF